MNYAELSAAVKSYCENDFPQTVGSGGLTSAEQIAIFVKQAEQRIYNSVQIPAIRRNQTGTLTSGNKYLTLPSDYLADFSFAVIDGDGNYEFLLNKDVNFIRQSFPDPTATGMPTHYAIFDANTYILGPTPDAAYNVELHYYYYPESIVTASTSWLGDNFSSVLLYGAMLEAATFMKSDEPTMKVYMERYNEAMALLKQLGDGKNRQDAYRSGQVRVPVR